MLKRRHTLLIVGIAVGALFTWLAVRDVDFDSILLALSRGNPAWALVFLAFLTAFCITKSARWAVLLDGIPSATSTRLFPTVLIGYFGTALMPLQLGEVLRAHSAARRVQAPFLTILSSLAVERIFDVLGLVLLLAAEILLGRDPGGAIWFGGLIMAAASVVLLALLVLAVAKPVLVHNAAAFLSRPFGADFQVSVIRHVDAGLAGLVVLKRPSKFVELLAYSVIQWLFMWGCVWASLQAFDLQLPLAAALSVLVAAVIGMMLPAAPGYIGTFQLAFTLALSPFGVSNADALVASIFYHVMLWVPLAIAGALCLRGTDLRLSRIIEEVEEGTGTYQALKLPEETSDPGDR